MKNNTYQYGFNKVKLIKFEERSVYNVAIIEDSEGNRKEVFKHLFDKHAVLIHEA